MSEPTTTEVKAPRAELKDFIFTSLADAKAAAEQQSKNNPRKRFVYRATVGDATVYITAQHLSRARSHAARHFQLDVELAESAARVAGPRKTIEETVTEMTDEQFKQLEDLVKARKKAGKQS